MLRAEAWLGLALECGLRSRQLSGRSTASAMALMARPPAKPMSGPASVARRDCDPGHPDLRIPALEPGRRPEEPGCLDQQPVRGGHRQPGGVSCPLPAGHPRSLPAAASWSMLLHRPDGPPGCQLLRSWRGRSAPRPTPLQLLFQAHAGERVAHGGGGGDRRALAAGGFRCCHGVEGAFAVRCARHSPLLSQEPWLEWRPWPPLQALSNCPAPHLSGMQRPDLFPTILSSLFEIVLFEDCTNQVRRWPAAAGAACGGSQPCGEEGTGRGGSAGRLPRNLGCSAGTTP